MTAAWPPLDLHAHVDVNVSEQDLLALRAVIFAATRSLDEAEQALLRQPRDLLTVWGVGVHPGVAMSLRAYDPMRFRALVTRSALVSEIGLDSKVPSRLPVQREVLRDILSALQDEPRIVSIHSYGSTSQVLDEIERTPIKGAVAHWWKGDSAATQRALDLGMYFSLNAANVGDRALAKVLPLTQVLIETDHPDGDRRSRGPRRPGGVGDVEQALSRHFGLSQDEVRLQTWRNLRRMISDIGCGHLLPPRVRSILDATPN